MFKETVAIILKKLSHQWSSQDLLEQFSRKKTQNSHNSTSLCPIHFHIIFPISKTKCYSLLPKTCIRLHFLPFRHFPRHSSTRISLPWPHHHHLFPSVLSITFFFKSIISLTTVFLILSHSSGFLRDRPQKSISLAGFLSFVHTLSFHRNLLFFSEFLHRKMYLLTLLHGIYCSH